MKKSLFLAGSAFALLVCLACEGAEGIVNAAWLNARVFPELKSPVAVKLPRNKKVEVTKRHGLWLEIAAPDTTPVFASAAFLDENKVLRDINLRIRPAAGAAVIGRVRKGDTLKAVSTPDRFGWVQVAPLPEMRLYVYKDYVTYDPAQVPVAKMTPAKEEKKTEPAPAKAADAKAAPAPVKPAPAPAPAPEKTAPAPAPKKEASAKAAPAPAGTDPAKAAPAPAKAAPVPAKAKDGFVLTPARRAQLLSLGADPEKTVKFEKIGKLVNVSRPNGDCTAYALLDITSGQSLGFVFAEAPIRLSQLVDKDVAVKGVAFRIPEWKNPVVGIETISSIRE